MLVSEKLLSTIKSISIKYIQLLPSSWKITDRRCLESFELQLFPPEKVAALSRSMASDPVLSLMFGIVWVYFSNL